MRQTRPDGVQRIPTLLILLMCCLLTLLGRILSQDLVIQPFESEMPRLVFQLASLFWWVAYHF